MPVGEPALAFAAGCFIRFGEVLKGEGGIKSLGRTVGS